MPSTMPNPKLLPKFFLSAAALFLTAPAALCQFETAAVLGTVFDAAGAVVHGARVTLANKQTGVTQETSADSSGNYQFLEVRLGEYQVRVEAAGFKKAETPDFR